MKSSENRYCLFFLTKKIVISLVFALESPLLKAIQANKSSSGSLFQYFFFYVAIKMKKEFLCATILQPYYHKTLIQVQTRKTERFF